MKRLCEAVKGLRHDMKAVKELLAQLKKAVKNSSEDDSEYDLMERSYCEAVYIVTEIRERETSKEESPEKKADEDDELKDA